MGRRLVYVGCMWWGAATWGRCEPIGELNGWVWDGREGGRGLWDECGLHGSWVPWRMNSGGGREKSGFSGFENEWGYWWWIWWSCGGFVSSEGGVWERCSCMVEVWAMWMSCEMVVAAWWRWSYVGELWDGCGCMVEVKLYVWWLLLKKCYFIACN